jgi:general secretion pathway protein A
VYTRFYNLREKPFNLNPSPRFLYLGEGHREALNLLKYGVMERKGFILLTGEIGTGKTTMIQALLSTLDDSVHCIHLSNPLLSPGEFMDYVAFSAFGKRIHFKSKTDFLIEFEAFLGRCLRHQTNVIMIIDEAQGLSLELLEEIRLLSNMETGDERLLNIFLVGQPELKEKLTESRGAPLLQRISIRYNIPPLDLEGTRGYIAKRLEIAGAERGNDIFSKSAVEAIHRYSGGIPRMINSLADNCLLLGYSRSSRTITPDMVRQFYQDMSLGESVSKEGWVAPKTSGAAQPGKRAFFYWPLAAILCVLIALIALGVLEKGPQKENQVPGKVEDFKTRSSADQNQVIAPKSPPVEIQQTEAEPIKVPISRESREIESQPSEEDRAFFSSIAIEEGVICRDVLSRSPVAAGTRFGASVDRLCCFTKVVGAQRPLEISHVWYFGDTKVATVNLPVKSLSWRTYSSKIIHPQYIGAWHVDVLGPDGEVLRSLPFRITPQED